GVLGVDAQDIGDYLVGNLLFGFEVLWGMALLEAGDTAACFEFFQVHIAESGKGRVLFPSAVVFVTGYHAGTVGVGAGAKDRIEVIAADVLKELLLGWLFMIKAAIDGKE